MWRCLAWFVRWTAGSFRKGSPNVADKFKVMNEKDNSALVIKPPSAITKAAPGVKRVLSDMVADTLALARKSPLRRIVIVNNEEGPLKALALMIPRLFSDVTLLLYQDSVEAWQELSQRNPDLVITGSWFPVMKGKELVERVMDRKATYPIIVMSAFEPEELWVQDYASRGLNTSFLPMPFNLETLQKLLVTSLNNPCKTIEKPVEPAAQTSRTVAAKYRIGEYEWCEPDYEQIQIWARAMALKPKDVVESFLNGKKPKRIPWAETIFRGGRLIKLNWDFELLPLDKFEWIADLAITHLNFPWELGTSRKNRTISFPLPKLSHLSCFNLGLTQLELSNLTQLEWLECAANPLNKLDLSNMPKLAHLGCWRNGLAELDLASVPKLTELWCLRNQLTHLDLSEMTLLTKLICRENPIAELDLSNIPELIELSCSSSRLTQLDLSKLPKLRELSCGGNRLTQLDTTKLLQLEKLSCSTSHLARLDLSGLTCLKKLDCSENRIVELDLRSVPNLERLYCSENPIKTLDIQPLRHLQSLQYDVGKTRLLQRPDQNF